jgi:SAM-dependent methyltransferase
MDEGHAGVGQPGPAAAYGEAIADVYDEWYGDVSDVAGTVATIAGLAGGGPVLELGVGTGRLALPLAATGLEVHGVDASPAMVARLRSKPGGGAVRVLVADFSVAVPRVPGGFAVAFAGFNTFLNLTTDHAQRSCLSLLADAVRPGGHVVIEHAVPADEPAPSGVAVRSATGSEVVVSAFVRDGAVVHGTLVALGADGVRFHPWAIALTTPAELDERAAAAGLARVARHGGWRGEGENADPARHVTFYQRVGGTVPL